MSENDNGLREMVLNIVRTIEEGDWGEPEEGEDYSSAYDFLQDTYDINYITHSDKKYKGARLLVAFGGPNIWIDTNLEQVEGYWWGDKFIAQYNHTNGAIELDDALEDLFNC